ncbi:MAG: prenyltransferase [Polyangiaceae bacterium]
MTPRDEGGGPDLPWGGPRFWQGVYRVADPKITLASVASMALGLALAAHDGPIQWGALAATVLGIFCIEAAKNASGELYDFDSGTDVRVTEEDRSPFSGGKRVLVDRLWTRPQTMAVAGVFYLLGAAFGVALAVKEPAVWGIGLVGAALAFFYHAPPFKLSYRGLGELAVFLTYGPLICAGAYVVQRGEIPLRAVHLGVPVGVMIAAFLFINEFPDARADEASGKRTIVVRIGRVLAARAFVTFPIVAFGYLALAPFAFGLPRGVWIGIIGLPHAILASKRLRASPDVTKEIVPAQAWTLLSFVLLSLGASVGLLVFR